MIVTKTKQKELNGLMFYTSNIIPEHWHSQKGMNNLIGFKNHNKVPVFSYFTTDLVTINNYIDNKHNYYVTMNTFKTRTRSNDNLAGLNAVYFDIDCLKNGVSKQELMDCLAEILLEAGLFYEDKLMAPSYEVDSGNGYYLIFLFKNQIIVNNPAIARLWSKVEREMAKRLNKAMKVFFNKELCDTKSTDPARLLRVPNTYNLKDENNPKLCHITHANNYRYDMFQLVKEFLPPYEPKKAHKGKRTKMSVKVAKNAYILNVNRCKDIEYLVENRGYDIKGYRETLLFIYATHLVKIMDHDEAINKLESLNNSFNEPLPDSEVKNLRYEINYLDLSKYKYSSRKIIEDLSISEDEQRQLITTISKKEKYRRKNEKRNKRRRQLSMTKGANAKKEKRNKQIMELKNKGFNNTQIANKLNISRSTIKRFLNQ